MDLNTANETKIANFVNQKLPTKQKEYKNLTKNTKPKLQWKESKGRKNCTPMATLEMVLTTKEFKKIQQLPKLPTDKDEAKAKNKTPAFSSTIQPAFNLTKPLPQGITIKPVTTWKAQVEILRKTVEEKLKTTVINDIKKNVQEHKYNKNLTCPDYQETLTCITEGTQTISNGFETCGFVQHSNKIQTFILTCFNCSAVYELSDWQQYMVHYNEAHNFAERNEKCVYETAFEATSPQTLTPTFSNITQIENDVDFAIIEELNDDDRASLSSREDSNSREQNATVINFYTSPSERILKFLKTLHNFPVLWHPRRYGPVVFDSAAEKFLAQFDNLMATDELYDSLKNARKLQKRSAKNPKSEIEPHLHSYVKMLNDIATLSKSYAYDCDHCTYYFLDENDLFKHKFKKHKIGDITHICSCGLHFADEIGKEAHEATHNNEPNFTCEHCGLSFFSKKKVENHIILSHPGETPILQQYECTTCNEKFARLYMLKWHKLKHDPPRYKCETCGKAYMKAFTYKHHVKSHLNQRDFICEECGKGFLAKGTLRKHTLKVHKTGKHVCTLCKKYFANYENLHAHKQKYHPDGADPDRQKKMHAIYVKRYHDRLKAERPAPPARKPLKCKQCNMEFVRVGELRKHKRKFGHFFGDRRYKCSHCDSILNSNQTFVIHLRKIHGIEAKYSDVKFYQPYTGCSDDDCESITNEVIDETEKYDDWFEEGKYAVQEIQYTVMKKESENS